MTDKPKDGEVRIVTMRGNDCYHMKATLFVDPRRMMLITNRASAQERK